MSVTGVTESSSLGQASRGFCGAHDPLFTLRTLPSLTAQSLLAEGFGPLTHPYLAIRLDAAEDIDPASLSTLPCPIIFIGNAAHSLADACDILLLDETHLPTIAANIARAPIAAATLVQLLRAAENLPVHHALTLESLAYGTLQNGAEAQAWRATHPPALPPAADASEPVLLERNGADLAITLNRPAVRNELAVPLRDALTDALRLAALDDTIATVTLQGAGKCFSIGGALHEFGTAPDPATAHAIRLARGPAFALAAVAPKTHARVHGACIGAGAELAALCGRVTAAPNAFFQLPEIRMGLIPGAGGTAAFTRRIGRQRTAFLALSARHLGARQALAWGLIDAIDPDLAKR